MIVYSEEQIKVAYNEGFKAGKESLLSSRLLDAVSLLEKDRDEFHSYFMRQDRVSFARQQEHDIIMDKFNWAIKQLRAYGV